MHSEPTNVDKLRALPCTDALALALAPVIARWATDAGSILDSA